MPSRIPTMQEWQWDKPMMQLQQPKSLVNRDGQMSVLMQRKLVKCTSMLQTKRTGIYRHRTASKTNSGSSVSNRNNSREGEGINRYVRRVFRDDGLLRCGANCGSDHSGHRLGSGASRYMGSNSTDSKRSKSQHCSGRYVSRGMDEVQIRSSGQV